VKAWPCMFGKQGHERLHCRDKLRAANHLEHFDTFPKSVKVSQLFLAVGKITDRQDTSLCFP